MNISADKSLFKIGEVTLTNEDLEIIQQLVKNKKNILITGERGSGKSTLTNLIIELLDSKDELLIFDFHDELLIPERFENTYVVGYGEKCDMRVNPKKREEKLIVKTAISSTPDTIIFDDIYGAEGEWILSHSSTVSNLIINVTSDSFLNGMKSIVLNTPFPTNKQIPIHLIEVIKKNFEYGITICDNKIFIERIVIRDNEVYTESV